MAGLNSYVKPWEGLGRIAESGLNLVGNLAYRFVTTEPIIRFNEEGGIPSRLTDILGYAIGFENQRYVYAEIDGHGVPHFLGASNEYISDVRRLLFEQEKNLNPPKLSDIANTCQSTEALTGGLLGHPRYDPLYSSLKNSIVGEQVALYMRYGARRVIGEIGGDSKASNKVVCVDRFNPLNMALSLAYWLPKEVAFNTLIYPPFKLLERGLERTRVAPIESMKYAVQLLGTIDTPFTGIGYYPNGSEEFMEVSPTSAKLQKIEQGIGNIDMLLQAASAAANPQAFVNQRKQLAEQRERIITSMGKYSTDI
jgi:hypothetical protein